MNSRKESCRRQIKAAYDKTVAAYNADRPSLQTHRYLRLFLEILPKSALILDLGCGSGEPVDVFLTKHGCAVTGIDFSTQQLKLAQKVCPNGQFIERDIATLKPNEFTVDGIVCLFALFHLPRATHLQWLKTIASYLPSGGPLLISMGDEDFEGWHDFYGERNWSSHFGPAKNRNLIKTAGFKIELDEIHRSGGEKHQIVIARKI